MKRSMWFALALTVAVALVLGGSTIGMAAKGKAKKGKPAQEVKVKEAPWEVVGVFAKEDMDEDDFDSLGDFGELTLRNYQRNANGETNLISKKKIQLEEFSVDNKPVYFVWGQEQLGNTKIVEKPHTYKVVPFKSLAELEKKPSKDSEDVVFELFAKDDKEAPARCWDAGTRVMTPPYYIDDWNACVYWARSTGRCREVRMPVHYPRLSTDGCQCWY